MTKRAVKLFSHAGLAKQWPSRITALLGILVEKDDGISPVICDTCTTRIHSLEKAAADLTAFKEMARCSRGFLEPRGPLKRAKATSGDVGVSPDTIKERPRSKISRTRLNFDSEYNKIIHKKLWQSFIWIISLSRPLCIGAQAERLSSEPTQSSNSINRNVTTASLPDCRFV